MITILFFLITLTCHAPDIPGTYVEQGETYYPYNIQDPILRSVAWYESRFDPDAENPVTKARGMLQITPAMITEVNKILREYGLPWFQYTWEDAWDAQKSIDIWYIVQTYHNPEYDLSKAVIIWFGRGVQYDGLTWRGYFADVKKYIET